MLVHNATHRISGFVAERRVKYIQTCLNSYPSPKLDIERHIQNLLTRYPAKNIYLNSTVNHKWLDNICELANIKQIDGFNPLNIPIDLSKKYSFTSSNYDDIPYGFNRYDSSFNSFISLTHHPSQLSEVHEAISRHQDNNTNIIAMVPVQGYKMMLQKWQMNGWARVLATFPKNTLPFTPSDHWYNNPMRKSFTNLEEIQMVLIGNSNSVNKGYIHDVHDITKSIDYDTDDPCIAGYHDISIALPKDSIYSYNKELNAEIFTDASLRQHKMGIGIWSQQLDIYESRQLKGMLDINRAEMGAILYALLRCKEKNKSICVLTDSQTSIHSICMKMQNEKYDILVGCIQQLMKDVEVKFRKVRGHKGIVGNENADFLASYSIHSNAPSIVLPDDLCSRRSFDKSMVQELIQETIQINDL